MSFAARAANKSSLSSERDTELTQMGGKNWGEIMASPRDCVEFAYQCERLAGLCEDDPQLREHLLDLAREWMAMFRHDRSVVATSRTSTAELK
jgi:hypothetical protein